MKFHGKISIWFLLLYVMSMVSLLTGIILGSKESTGVLLGAIVVINILFMPIIIRNYVRVDEERLIIVFGFIKETINISEICTIRQTYDFRAATAASLDRLLIISSAQTNIISIKNVNPFLAEIMKRNPEAKIIWRNC